MLLSTKWGHTLLLASPGEGSLGELVASTVHKRKYAIHLLNPWDVASRLKYSMRTWENEGPWTSGAYFCRGYTHFYGSRRPYR